MRELVANPRGVGAACPSSKGLARIMASFIPKDDDGYIVELGAGTGVVTAAILERGIDPSRLIVVEISEDLVKMLRKQFPNVRIVHGNAAALKDHLDYSLGEGSNRVSTIVSSLPMRSLPEKLVDAIKQQLHDILPHNGRLIHFTYALKPVSQNYLTSFQRTNSKIRWRNVPPARVEVYHRSQLSMKKD
ncbi:MAG: methyltransferase domain-containing protein [Calditrichaeota bacterium]|nr:MAG: methyltransferase domain-containing protein [Calditrichota bacterium]